MTVRERFNDMTTKAANFVWVEVVGHDDAGRIDGQWRVIAHRGRSDRMVGKPYRSRKVAERRAAKFVEAANSGLFRLQLN
jgi:hypothetical protein